MPAGTSLILVQTDRVGPEESLTREKLCPVLTVLRARSEQQGFDWPPTWASRRHGIGCKTGYRWRAENGGLQPDYLTEASRSGRYLSLLERRRWAICPR